MVPLQVFYQSRCGVRWVRELQTIRFAVHEDITWLLSSDDSAKPMPIKGVYVIVANEVGGNHDGVAIRHILVCSPIFSMLTFDEFVGRETTILCSARNTAQDGTDEQACR